MSLFGNRPENKIPNRIFTTCVNAALNQKCYAKELTEFIIPLAVIYCTFFLTSMILFKKKTSKLALIYKVSFIFQMFNFLRPS